MAMQILSGGNRGGSDDYIWCI